MHDAPGAVVPLEMDMEKQDWKAAGVNENKDRFCTAIGKRRKRDSIAFGPGHGASAAHNTAATRGSCQARRSLGGN